MPRFKVTVRTTLIYEEERVVVTDHENQAEQMAETFAKKQYQFAPATRVQVHALDVREIGNVVNG